MKSQILLTLICLISLSGYSQEFDSAQYRIDKIEQSLQYTTGTIELEHGNAKLNVPKGFRFLDREQSNFVLTDLWGNPSDTSVLGMLVPEGRGVLQDNSWVFTISYDEVGYIEDDDADDIDYDDLLTEQQAEFKEENPQRIEQGYPPIEFIGWASEPHYDQSKKILHWAKELKFGEDSLHTLNYNLRVLGRKGMFVINAIASLSELNEVNANIDNVIASVEFKEGSQYKDFDPKMDEVAAWTIGGLVAGKVLAKVGFFALALKFWKLISVALIAAGSALWKFITGRKKETAPVIVDKDNQQ